LSSGLDMGVGRRQHKGHKSGAQFGAITL